MEAIDNKGIIKEQLQRAEFIDSWTQFTGAGGLGSSASKIAEVLEAGKFLEVSDRKFQGTPVVLLRKSDYEKLLLNSRTSFRVKKLLAMLSRAVMSFKLKYATQENERELNVIETTLSLGIELSKDANPLYSSREAYLSASSEDASSEVDFNLPSSKSALKDGVIGNEDAKR
jgi:hypothetical protein